MQFLSDLPNTRTATEYQSLLALSRVAGLFLFAGKQLPVADRTHKVQLFLLPLDSKYNVSFTDGLHLLPVLKQTQRKDNGTSALNPDHCKTKTEPLK